MKWKSNKEKTEWTSADFKIVQAIGPHKMPIYHCYDNGDYVAQHIDLDEAKACFID